VVPINRIIYRITIRHADVGIFWARLTLAVGKWPVPSIYVEGGKHHVLDGKRIFCRRPKQPER
jgi:hypothetical protein